MNISNRTLWSHLKTGNVTVSVTPQANKYPSNTEGYIFVVQSIIDTGNGRRSLILDQLEGIPAHAGSGLDGTLDKPSMTIPYSSDEFSFVITQKKQKPHSCIQSTLHYYFDKKIVQDIVPEIFMPGDLVVFEYSRKKTITMRAVRIENAPAKGISKHTDALPSSEPAGR